MPQTKFLSISTCPLFFSPFLLCSADVRQVVLGKLGKSSLDDLAKVPRASYPSIPQLSRSDKPATCPPGGQVFGGVDGLSWKIQRKMGAASVGDSMG